LNTKRSAHGSPGCFRGRGIERGGGAVVKAGEKGGGLIVGGEFGVSIGIFQKTIIHPRGGGHEWPGKDCLKTASLKVIAGLDKV